MRKRFSSAIPLVVLALVFAMPAAATAAIDPSGAVPPAATDDGTTDTAPLTLTPDEIAELTDASESQQTESSGFFGDAGDFITDNAPYFIIGIIVLAAIIAGILIMRGRKRKGATDPAAASAAAGAPASVPSATELRRRKRAAMQRAREEERLRRKAGKGAAGEPARSTGARQAMDPIAAEKQAARDQAQAAGAVARSGTIMAPPTPSQTAPAAGVAPPSAASASQPAAASAPAPAPAAAQPPAQPEPSVEVPTRVEPVVETAEPAIEAPGSDATVGRAAAAFAAGAAGGAIAAGAASGEQQSAEDRLQAKVDEIKSGQSQAVDPEPESEIAEPQPEVAEHSVADETAEQPEVPSPPDASEPIPPPIPGLSAVERQLSSDSKDRDRALQEAERRLRLIEQRAEDAERRAAFAERLAQLKVEESERERRLNDVISSIDRAEERTREAELRAEAAERAAAAALEGGSIDRGPVEARDEGPIGSGIGIRPAAGPQEAEPETDPQPHQRDSDDPAAADKVEGTIGSGSESSRPVGESTPVPSPPSGSSGGVNLNSATFEQLREADLSVTQATRILAYRERFGGYRSFEDLEKVPGFPPDLIEGLRGRLSV